MDEARSAKLLLSLVITLFFLSRFLIADDHDPHSNLLRLQGSSTPRDSARCEELRHRRSGHQRYLVTPTHRWPPYASPAFHFASDRKLLQVGVLGLASNMSKESEDTL